MIRLCLLLFWLSFASGKDFLKNLDSLRWVAFSPAGNWQPGQNASIESLRVDLESLYSAQFRGIVTYGTLFNLDSIPNLAKRIGFSSVIVGVWLDNDTFHNRLSLNKAIALRDWADGYCVGNEVLFRRYYLGLDPLIDSIYLREAIRLVRESTGKPTTTSEPFFLYLNDTFKLFLCQNSDFLFPIANPTDNGLRQPEAGAFWVKGIFEAIRRVRDSLIPQRPLLLKESGWPTHSEIPSETTWANERNQMRYFRTLESLRDTSLLRFVWFEGFDQFWKRDAPTQPYWGLFDKRRRRKLFLGGTGLKEGKREERKKKTLGGIFYWPYSQLYDLIGRLLFPKKISNGVYFQLGKRKKVFLKTF